MKTLSLVLLTALSWSVSAKEATSPSPWQKYNLEPVTKENHKPDKDTDEGGLWMASAKIEEATKRSPFLVKDEVLNKRINDMVCEIAGSYCKDFRVYILRNPHFNASMFPNGMMHIWTGLLLRVDNEAQLAAVIGHEIAHYLKNHSMGRWRSLKSQTGAAVWVSMVTSGAGVGIVGDIFTLGVIAGIMSYSRENESEADAYGLKLLAEAGYDPNQASLVWEYIDQENKSAKYPHKNNVFSSSHPSPINRKHELSELCKDLPEATTPYRLGDKELQGLLKHQYPQLMDAEINKRLYGRTETLLKKVESRNLETLSIDYYWSNFYRARNAEGDKKLAKEHLEKAVEATNSPPEAYRDFAYIHLKNKNIESAKYGFKRYLELLPNATDKEMIEFYLNRDD